MDELRDLGQLAWPEVEAYLRQDDRLLLVVGACEQHGPHLPFTTDVDLPWAIAQRAARATGVLLAPPVTFGMSLHHMKFPGTLSLQPETLIAVLRDLFVSSYRHGFRRVTVVNGHGGNRAALQSAAVSVLAEHEDLQIKVMHWWEAPPVLTLTQQLFGGRENHATAVETACMLALDRRVQMQEARFSQPVSGVLVMGPRQWKHFYPHGSAGLDPGLATREAGEQLLALAADQLCGYLQDW